MATKKTPLKGSPTELFQLQAFTTFLCILLIVSLLFACIGVPLAPRAHASGSEVTLDKIGNITYAGEGWNTHIFMANDGAGPTTAYCVQPRLKSPAKGSYPKSALACPSGRDAQMRAHMWFAYDGPGFDESMWPSTNWDGQPMSAEDYYLASHILLSDTFSSAGYEATHGATEAFRNWIAWNVLGFDLDTGAISNMNAFGHVASRRYGEVPAHFETYMIDGGSSQTIAAFSKFVPYGTIKVQKRSAYPDVSKENPNYSMAGITYGVYTASSCDDNSDTGMRIVLDENGCGESEEFKSASYFVREIEASTKGTGFAYDSTAYPCTMYPGKATWVYSVQSDDDYVRDTPITCKIDVLLQKYDMLTRAITPSSEADMSNARFEVSFYANTQGDASGTPVRSWIFKTDDAGKVDLRNDLRNAFVSGDKLFYAGDKDVPVFPIGTYAVKELQAPASYELPVNAEPVIFTIDASGTGAHDASSKALRNGGIRFDEMPVRHDLFFTKHDLDTQRPMTNIPFLVSRLAQDGSVIERHVAVTDANGIFSSSADHALHTTKTNENDEALVIKDNGRYVVKEDKLSSDNGLWFGVARDGSWIAPNDECGAFPDSTTTRYVFEELPVKANEGKALVSFEAYAHGARSSAISLGTVGNITPTLATVARDGYDGDKIVSKAPDAWVVDAVAYTGLVAGRSYALKATLVNAATGVPVEDDGGAPVSSERTFTAQTSSGNLDIELRFDAMSLSTGDKLVVCEELFEQDRPLATHWDLLDSAQTVTIVEPTLQTQAFDQRDGDSVLTSDCEVTILDTVSYTGLVPGKEYVLSGSVMDRSSANQLEVGSEPITSTARFVAQSSSGSASVSFTFDASDITAGSELVVFEELSQDGHVIASHQDINDPSQTVTVFPPHLETKAHDTDDGDNIVAADIQSQITDIVNYSGLTPDREYVLEGILIDKDTGRPLLDAFERPIQATRVFVPELGDGAIEVDFSFDASHMTKSYGAVVFQELYRDGKHLASHTDLNSADQSVIIEPPSIQTFASAEGTSKSIMRDVDVSILDTISYRNLRPGVEYELVATLLNQETGRALTDEEGQAITSSKRFTAQRTIDTIDLSLTLDATKLKEGDRLVVFERLYRDGVLIASHEDLESERQTVTVVQPGISTRASSTDDTKTIVRDTSVTVIDHVNYTGLAPNRSYELVGTIMDAATGNALIEPNGDKVTARANLVPESPDGETTLSFEFNASQLLDDQELVVFEQLYRGGKLIASHEDLGDRDQTVTIVPVAIVTQACDPADGDKVVAAHAQTTIIDTVSYKGLEPGVEYTLAGYLVGVETGECLLTAQGNPAQTNHAFTPQASSGSVDVVFSYDASNVQQQQDAVIFEELYRDGDLIAAHADIDNKAQTVSVAPVSIQTYASDAYDGDKELERSAQGSIADTVAYSGLIPGQEYELRGKLMVNDGTLEGRPLLDSFGSAIEAHVSFKPSETHGSVNVNFNIDTTTFAHDTSLVAYEKLYCEQTLVAQHEDLQDEDQTIIIKTGVPAPSPVTPADQHLTKTSFGSQVYTGDAAALLIIASALIGLTSLGILSVLRRKAFGSPPTRR